MDKFAVFVDAGYLLSCGAELCTGMPGARRAAAVCAYGPLISSLIKELQQRCNRELLRVYWYDGANNQVPTTDHLAIAALPDVKVRLGRVVRNEQKGVDTLIVLDLTSLARERAISTAYLLSGDEDIREGVVQAQQLGVRLVLVGLEPLRPQQPNQAGTMIREADEHIVLSTATYVTPYFSQAKQLVIPAVQAVASKASAPPSAPAATAQSASVPAATTPPSATVAAKPNPYDVGQQFAKAWLAGKPTAADLAAMSSAKLHRPRMIPQTIDSPLLRQGVSILGMSPLPDQEKKELRRGFWDAIP